MIWAAVAVGFVLTVFGVAASAALITVSRADLADAVSRRLRGAAESLDWLRDAERELAAATATTGLGIAVLAVGLSGLVDWITGDLPLWGVLVLLIGVALPFVLMSGYVLPRWLTAQRASRAADLFRPILRPWSRMVAWVLPELKKRPVADVRALWREGAAGALTETDELVMVSNVITFAQRPIREVMTPRTNLAAIPEGAQYDEIHAAFVQSGYSRLPVYRGTIDDVVGMVHVFDLFKITPADPVPVRPIGAAPASRTSGDVLLDMQRERRHLTVVLDEFGGTLGIVTLEDLLEAMVGEIFDENDETAERRIPDSAQPFETDGGASLDQVEQRFGVVLPDGPSRSIGGRLVELLGRFPRAGERLRLSGLEFDILAVSPTRIDRLVVRRIGADPITLDPPGS
ncbi:MAG: HlyC/CorC family transporter [Gemmatimonadales bacterium]|nr:HlyC/CorC family transporter [Gemmatimonadales bacterium]